MDNVNAASGNDEGHDTTSLVSSPARQKRPTASRNRTIALLSLIWACFLLRGIFYSSLLPLWEGYDEFSHFAYVEYLGTTGRLPIPGQTPVSKEIQESLRVLPVAWALGSLPPPSVTHDVYWTLTAQERESREEELRSMPRSWAREPSTDTNLFWESLQPPLYYWLASGIVVVAANEDLPARVILVRWFSVAMTSLVIPLGFLLTRKVLRDSGLALAIVALITAMPEMMIVISRVGNDSLATPLYTLLALLALRWLDEPTSVARASWVGVVFGLGLLTKAYFLTAGPVLALIPIAALWFALWSGRQRLKVLFATTAAGLAAVFVAGWWYLRNYRSTGMWVLQPGSELVRGMPLFKALSRSREVDWANVLRSVQISHIWYGAWSFLQVRGWMYKILWDIFLLACVGLVVCAWRLLRDRGSCAVRDKRYFLVLVGLYGLFCLGIAYDALLVFLLTGVSTTDGRYLYCPIVVEVILISAGLLALVPRVYGRWILPAITFCFVLLELYATHFLLIPYYAGVIVHRPNGGLVTFHVFMLKSTPISVVIRRLLVNKANFLGAPLFVGGWILFLLCTASLVWISQRSSCTLQADEAE